MRVGSPRKRLSRPALWLPSPTILLLLVLSVGPLGLIFFWSFWTWDPTTYWIRPDLTLSSYVKIFTTGRLEVFVRSGVLSLIAATLSVSIGYPVAYYMYFIARRRVALVLMLLFTIPFLTSYLIRTFSWRFVLGRNGLVNTTLVNLGLIDEPIEWLLFSDFAVQVGLVASYFPFVIFPLLLSFRRVGPEMLRASQDLGAGFWRTLWEVVLPLTKPGVFAGFLFVFVLALGSSTEVQLLGGAGESMIAIMINDVMRVVNFPLAFAISSAVVLLLIGLLFVGNRFLGLSRLFEDFSW